MKLTREEYALQPQDWIQIIIEKCGLNQDVDRCLAKQLEKFEEYKKLVQEAVLGKPEQRQEGLKSRSRPVASKEQTVWVRIPKNQ